MAPLSWTAVLMMALGTSASLASQNFTISNGQIFTPGFAVLNAPQPETPMGGKTLHISLDVTANGELPLPSKNDDDGSSMIHNITVFLYSYDTGRNFTITNGTRGREGASLGDIMKQQESSTVKHIDWVWPSCLVGNGQPDDDDSDRGVYNISIRQNFRLNGDDHYTIFDVPISVTNSIEKEDERISCDDLDNELLSPEEIDAEAANEVGVFLAPDNATEIDVDGKDGGDGDEDEDDAGARSVSYASWFMMALIFLAHV